MKYFDGQDMRAGDLLRTSPNSEAVVLCDFNQQRCVEGFDWESWRDYLSDGVLVEDNQIGLVHLVAEDADLELLARDYCPTISYRP